MKGIRRSAGGLLVGALMAGGAALHAEDPVTISVSGRYYPRPATVRVAVTVPPREDNRMLRIEADGPDFYRSSEMMLHGDLGPRLHSMLFKNLPAGHYVLRASLLDSDGDIWMAEAKLVVTP